MIVNRNLKGFLLFLLSCLLIVVYVSGVYPMLTQGLYGYANESISPSRETATKAVWSIMPANIMFIATVAVYYYKKCKRYNKFVYPIILIMSVLLYVQTAIADGGSAAAWLLVMLMIPIMILLPILFIVGWIVDALQKKAHKDVTQEVV